MKIYPFCLLLLLLPFLSACQADDEKVPDTPEHVFTVRATLPGGAESRTQITYGNKEIDREIFRWTEKTEKTEIDWITVFNISRLSECPYGVVLEAISIDGPVAIFQSVADAAPDFKIFAGDLILVSYWETGRLKSSNPAYADRDIFSIDVASIFNKPQLIVKNPDNTTMAYMQSNLKMYDIVTAVEDNKIPDIHFRHLSAIMRITLRNETDKYFAPKELQFEYPGTESFFANNMYFSVDPESPDGSGLTVYDSEEFWSTEVGYSEPYSDMVQSNINNYTAALDADKGDSIAPGESYDLYLSAVPRIANTKTGEKLIIRLYKRLTSETSEEFAITLDDFKVPIVAGKRYWFNLVAVRDEDGTGRLVLASDWPEPKPDPAPEQE